MKKSICLVLLLLLTLTACSAAQDTAISRETEALDESAIAQSKETQETTAPQNEENQESETPLPKASQESAIPQAEEIREPETTLPEESVSAVTQTEVSDVTCTFLWENIALTPGDIPAASVLAKARSVYEVPSCAIDGMDRIYDFDAFELTTVDNGTQERIYSIVLLDPNITTPEGLALGDSLEVMVKCYGDGYSQLGDSYTYTGNGCILCIIAQGTCVASIEYRLILA